MIYWIKLIHGFLHLWLNTTLLHLWKQFQNSLIVFLKNFQLVEDNRAVLMVNGKTLSMLPNLVKPNWTELQSTKVLPFTICYKIEQLYYNKMSGRNVIRNLGLSPESELTPFFTQIYRNPCRNLQIKMMEWPFCWQSLWRKLKTYRKLL